MTSYAVNLPRASVLIPTYNDSRYLREAVGSILSQTFQDFELLIIDDGSTDDTPKIIGEYDDPRITVITHSQNLGRPFARNAALDAAKGEYLFWMDADDISLPTRMEKQVAFMDTHPDIAVCGGAMQCFNRSDKRQIFPQKYKDIHTALFLAPAISNPTACIRRAAIERHGIRYNESLLRAEDYEFWCRMLLDCKLKAANLPNTVLLYRMRVAAYWESHTDVQRLVLSRLGVEATDAHLALHVELALATKAGQMSYSLERYRDFVSAVLEANSRERVFDQRLLAKRLYKRIGLLIFISEASSLKSLMRSMSLIGTGRTAQALLSYFSRKLLRRVAEKLQLWGE